MLKGLKKRRFESLGTLCNSVSHQMSNRFHAILLRCAVPMEMFKRTDFDIAPRDALIKLIHALFKSMERIVAIAKDGGKITDTVLNYSKGKMDFGLLNFDDVVNNGIEFAQYKHSKFHYEIKRDFAEGIKIWGASAPLQDVIFNALDNSCLAMIAKKNKDENFKTKRYYTWAKKWENIRL